MNWDRIVEQIPVVVEQVKEDYVLGNTIIRDDIFGVLEKHCIVVYYPLENEDNCGFHTKRFLKDSLEDFVYINTAKPIAEQVFAAAHELGHVWKVGAKVWEQAREVGYMSISDEERIINRFAAELLMPEVEFKKTFWEHMKQLKLDQKKVKIDDMVRVMVMQMNDYMVPYESVRRRMIETEIISSESGEILCSNYAVVMDLVSAFSKEQNTMLDRVTAKKTIPGLRNDLEIVESKCLLDRYAICQIKKDFDIVDVNSTNDVINIYGAENKDGEN